MRALMLVSAIIFLGGCTASESALLAPSPGARMTTTPEGEKAAVSSVAGVRILVNAKAWPGAVPIGERVTPLKLRVENNSDKSVAIQYTNIKLVGRAGAIFSALPPSKIDMTVRGPSLAPGFPVIGSPASAQRFAIAPLYAPAYPQVPVATGNAFYGPPYDNYYAGPNVRHIDFPTLDMLRLALPEGVVAPGGSVEGFIYFQEVDEDLRHVRFRMDILDADSGHPMGRAAIPLLVSPA